MAEEQVMPQANVLVLQTEREKFCSKLQNMRLNNLTAKQQQKLNENKERFCWLFIALSYSFLV